MSDSNPYIIEAAGVGKHVATASQELEILSGIELRIKSGASVAVVGASGSGKSTLLGLLAGLDSPSTGTISLAGRPLDQLDEDGRAEVRKARVGFVFQNFQLLPSLTALENVMLPLELADARDAGPRARALLERVGLSERLDHYPKQLSGGEQQRVAIARAFACEPRVVFADEPTGNLDAGTGEQIAELMFGINREFGTTLVLVTHDEALAARCGERIHLQAGRIVSHD